jgi:hypothetical protein
MKNNGCALLKNTETCTNSHLARYAWLSAPSGTPRMLATKGTLPIARRAALSTGYVATEIIIGHRNLYMRLNQPTNQPNNQTTNQPTNQPTKQPTKQPTNQRNKHESYFVISTPFDKDKVRQLSSENVTVQAAIHTPHTCNQYLEAVLPEMLRSVRAEREPLPIMEPKGVKHPTTRSSHKPHNSNTKHQMSSKYPAFKPFTK